MANLTFIKVQTDKDINDVSKKAEIIWRDHFTSIIGEDQVTYMLDLFLSFHAISKAIKEEGYTFYKILKSGKLIGFFSIRKETERMFLSKLYVEKAQRGNGYARQTLNYIEEISKAVGVYSIWLTCNKDNGNTLAIYQKMGFTIFDEAVNAIGDGYVMDDYYLIKNL